MEFNGQLDEQSQKRVHSCDQLLTDPSRLAALERTGLMASPNEHSFDRLAELAARILDAPLTLVSLVGADQQFFKASYGLPFPERSIPIDGSICRYTLGGEPIVVSDASQDPFLKLHPATEPWGIVAFLSVPMILPDGHVLGAFCAVKRVVHVWTKEELHVLEELTASVMTEINLRIQLSALEKERELRNRFVATLTHDLRTPLSAARLYAQLGMPQKVVTNLDRVDRMIYDLLDATRIKAGEGIPIQPKECDLGEVCAGAVEQLRSVHGDRFELGFEVGTVKGVWDRDALQRVVENLASNAVKYGAPERTIRIRVLRGLKYAEIAVHNHGAPIPESDQALLFDSFSRATSAVQSGKKGWGIGLALVKAIAEAHQGSVRVESRPEAGTTFLVRLPYAAS